MDLESHAPDFPLGVERARPLYQNILKISLCTDISKHEYLIRALQLSVIHVDSRRPGPSYLHSAGMLVAR